MPLLPWLGLTLSYYFVYYILTQKIWDMLDLWHYKLNELDAEVQDIVEQDPCHAQEWMDTLMIPVQRYQQVSQRAERRTADLNKVEANLEVPGLQEESYILKGDC